MHVSTLADGTIYIDEFDKSGRVLTIKQNDLTLVSMYDNDRDLQLKLQPISTIVTEHKYQKAIIADHVLIAVFTNDTRMYWRLENEN